MTPILIPKITKDIADFAINIYKARNPVQEVVTPQDTTQMPDTSNVEIKPVPFVFNLEAYKHGITYPETGGVKNYEAMNPQSTATGAYQILFSQAKPWLQKNGFENIKTRKQFAKSPDAQEAIMNARSNEAVNIHAKELTEEYRPQLGDKWNYNEADVAALVHFMGRQGTRYYFGAIRDSIDPVTVLPAHVKNLPPDEYLKRFRKGYQDYLDNQNGTEGD